VPEAGDTLTHAAVDDTDHDVFEVTSAVAEAPAATGSHQFPDKVRLGATSPGCDTASVRVTPGVPEVVVKVTVADRAAADVFACAVKVTVPFPVPEVGDTATHAAFDDADQDVFAVSATEVEPLPTGAAHDDPDKVNAGATCPG